MKAEMLLPIKKIYRNARWKLAYQWLLWHPEVETIGITGSVGKTTVKEIIATILAEQFSVVKTKANFDPIFNIPLTILKIKGSEKLVAEMGIDKVGQMDKYLTLIKPRIGVVTRFSEVHLDDEHFGSLETMMAEKSKLVKALPNYGWAVLNGDDPNVRRLSKNTAATSLLIGFGSDNDFIISDFTQKIAGNSAVSSFNLKFAFGKEHFESGLLGKHNAFEAAIGVVVGMIMGLEFNQIKNGLLKIRPVEHRLEVKKGKTGLVIDDTYNASPEAVKAGIDVLTALTKEGALILGNMLELGSSSGKIHYEVGRYAALKKVARIVVIGDNAQDVVDGYLAGSSKKENIFIAQTQGEIISWVEKQKPKTILVKGSRGMKMEKIVESLVK